MRHLTKGKDLYDASAELEILKETLKLLKDCTDQHRERLERTRERMEGALRLHEVLEKSVVDPAVHGELMKLAELVDVPTLAEQCRKLMTVSSHSKSDNRDTNTTSTSDNISLDISMSDDTITATSTPEKVKPQQMVPTLIEPGMQHRCKSDHGHHHHHEDEEEQSKMADSGLGGCDRCEGNEKLERTCSCQSLNDPKNAW